MAWLQKEFQMKKNISYLCGGFAAFNLLIIFPAFMSGASADWIGWRILCVLIFGAICYLFADKKKMKSEELIKGHGDNNPKCNYYKPVSEETKESERVEYKQKSLFSSSTTETIAKKLFSIASDSISEIINVSGVLNEKGLCEAIIFNSNIILNDSVLKLEPCYDAVSNYYLTLLYFLIKQQRTDMEGEKLINLIKERIEFYSDEYNKLRESTQYTPLWVYSTFYLTPLEDEPKPYLDILQVMTFQVGLIRMACKIHELLNKLLNEKTL